MRNYTFRLKPGQDSFESPEAFIKERHIEAGCILSGLGSLTANRDHWIAQGSSMPGSVPGKIFWACSPVKGWKGDWVENNH